MAYTSEQIKVYIDKVNNAFSVLAAESPTTSQALTNLFAEFLNRFDELEDHVVENARRLMVQLRDVLQGQRAGFGEDLVASKLKAVNDFIEDFPQIYLAETYLEVDTDLGLTPAAD